MTRMKNLLIVCGVCVAVVFFLVGCGRTATVTVLETKPLTPTIVNASGHFITDAEANFDILSNGTFHIRINGRLSRTVSNDSQSMMIFTRIYRVNGQTIAQPNIVVTIDVGMGHAYFEWESILNERPASLQISLLSHNI